MRRGSFQRLKALVLKECFQIFRDSSSLLIAVIFPVLLIFLYAVGVSLDMRDLKVGIFLEDRGSSSRDFYRAIRNSKFFKPVFSNDKEKLERMLIAGDIKGIITVPSYFTKDSKAGRAPPIYVVADGSGPNSATFVQNYVRKAFLKSFEIKNISKGIKERAVIEIEDNFWYNKSLNSRFFLIPGAIAIIMKLVGTLLTALVIAREWERGTMESLMSTPVSIFEIYLAKLATYFIVGLLSAALCSFLSIVIFGVPFRGSYLLLALVSSCFLLTALATGLLISSATKSQFLASALAVVLAFLPAFMLSGFVFEISSMPFLIRLISNIIPARYMVSSMKTIFLAGNVWGVVLKDILFLLLIAFILFFVMSVRARKRLD